MNGYDLEFSEFGISATISHFSIVLWEQLLFYLERGQPERLVDFSKDWLSSSACGATMCV